MLFMAVDLGRNHDVQRLAPKVLASSDHMERRRVLCTTALANSYLPRESNSRSDLDRACELLRQVIPSLSSLSSIRTLEQINSVRHALTTHTGHSSVQEVEELFRASFAVAETPR